MADNLTYKPTNIEILHEPTLRAIGAYWRRYLTDGKGIKIDLSDKKPFSTDFTFTRFLVPYLMDYKGWAVFCDGDFFFLNNPAELSQFTAFDKYAVSVVKHNHLPVEKTKHQNRIQSQYPRKNWSSLIVWNCGHPQNKGLTPKMVNTMPGRWLHQFSWLSDDVIGNIPEAWNWLVNWSSIDINPKAIHYTQGTPNLLEYSDTPYSKEWLDTLTKVKSYR